MLDQVDVLSKFVNKNPQLAEKLEEDMQEKEFKIQQQWNPQLFNACKTGNLKKLKESLDNGADMHQWDKKNNRKWTPLIWACCKGFTDIVRVLIDHGVLNEYLKEQKRLKGEDLYEDFLSEDGSQVSTRDTVTDEHGKPYYGHINMDSKPSPLMWACFKGHVRIVCLLLKNGLEPIDYDLFGNTVMHQAVSGGNAEVFKTLLQYGIYLDEQNSRKHSIYDLATDESILSLIEYHNSAKEDSHLKEKFTEGEKRFLCGICGKFYKQQSTKLFWRYETHQSLAKELIECRCKTCQADIDVVTQRLDQSMKDYDEENLRQTLMQIDRVPRIQNRYKTWEEVDIPDYDPDMPYEKIHVDEKSLHQGHILLEKIRTQNVISRFISQLDDIEDYKTIKKSIQTIDAMLDDTKDRLVMIDLDFKDMAFKTKARILAERNLRFQLDNLKIATATTQQVEQLTNLWIVAGNRNVQKKYLYGAKSLRDKMAKSIEVQRILIKLQNYPNRVDKIPTFGQYPPQYVYDFHTREARVFKPNGQLGQIIDKKRLDRIGMQLKVPIQNYYQVLSEPPKIQKKRKKRKRKSHAEEFDVSIPIWAQDTTEDEQGHFQKGYKRLNQVIENLKELLLQQKELELTEIQISQCDEEINRLLKEFRYRWMQEVQLKLYEESLKGQAKKR